MRHQHFTTFTYLVPFFHLRQVYPARIPAVGKFGSGHHIGQVSFPLADNLIVSHVKRARNPGPNHVKIVYRIQGGDMSGLLVH
jgi:hypothetical protein